MHLADARRADLPDEPICPGPFARRSVTDACDITTTQFWPALVRRADLAGWRLDAERRPADLRLYAHWLSAGHRRHADRQDHPKPAAWLGRGRVRRPLGPPAHDDRRQPADGARTAAAAAGPLGRLAMAGLPGGLRTGDDRAILPAG